MNQAETSSYQKESCWEYAGPRDYQRKDIQFSGGLFTLRCRQGKNDCTKSLYKCEQPKWVKSYSDALGNWVSECKCYSQTCCYKREHNEGYKIVQQWLFTIARRFWPWQNIKLWCQEKHRKDEKNNLTYNFNLWSLGSHLLVWKAAWTKKWWSMLPFLLLQMIQKGLRASRNSRCVALGEKQDHRLGNIKCHPLVVSPSIF